MNRALKLALALAIALSRFAGAGIAAAQAPSPAEAAEATSRDGWTPALNLSLNIFNFTGEGEVSSPIGQSNRNSASRTLGEFRIGLDLMSPALDLGFAKPRVVGLGGLQVGPRYNVAMAQLGKLIPNQPVPADISTVATKFDNNGVPYPNSPALAGQGSLVNATYLGLGWYAGIGLDFPVPRFESLLRVRPYAVYTGEKMSAQGQLVGVTGTGAVIPQTPDPLDISPDYVVYNAVTTPTEEDFHFIGPGVELDLIATRGRRVEIVLFTAGDFLFNVGDGQIAMRAGTTSTGTNVISTPRQGQTDPPPIITFFPNAAPSQLTTYTYTAPDFRFNLQFGIRFGWQNLF